MKTQIKKIAVLTSGGDAPGMNAAIRAVVKSALHYNLAVYGSEDGFQGLIENRLKGLSYSDVNNIIQLGGTILGTARSEAFRTKEGRAKAYMNLRSKEIDALVVIGGDGSYAGANAFSSEFPIPVIGIPGTIDNDIDGTHYTIGYDTCLNTIVDAVDKIRDTASSHRRIFFIEVMGRNAGKIALNAAIASGADTVLLPEIHDDIEKVAKDLIVQYKGERSCIVIVAEGDSMGGAKQVVEAIAPFLPNFDLRYSILGHLQRGGSPSPFDRIVATQMGNLAVEILLKGENRKMICSINNQICFDNLVNPSIETKNLNPVKLQLLDTMRTK